MASSTPVDRETGRDANNTVSEEQDVGSRDHEQSPQVDNANNNNNNSETVASSDQVEEQQDSSSPSKRKKSKKKKNSGGGPSPPKSQNKSSAVQQQYEAMTRAAGLSSEAARTGVKTNVGTPLQADTTKAHGSESNEPKLVGSGPGLQPLGGHTPNMQHLPQGYATGPMSLLRNVTQKASRSSIARMDLLGSFDLLVVLSQMIHKVRCCSLVHSLVHTLIVLVDPIQILLICHSVGCSE